jgi:hypothetical protein
MNNLFTLKHLHIENDNKQINNTQYKHNINTIHTSEKNGTIRGRLHMAGWQ